MPKIKKEESFIEKKMDTVKESLEEAAEQIKDMGESISGTVKEIVGEKKLEKIILSKPHNGSSEIIVDGLFIEIGAVPSVALPKSLGVELDERGYVKVDNMMKTNIDGFFAAGDVVGHFGRFKQDITAAAMGTVAATSTYEDNKIHGDLCQLHGIPTQ